MNSRIPVLIGLVLLILSLSLLDLSLLPISFTGVIPYLAAGIILFLVLSRGPCCTRRCDGDPGADATTAS